MPITYTRPSGLSRLIGDGTSWASPASAAHAILDPLYSSGSVILGDGALGDSDVSVWDVVIGAGALGQLPPYDGIGTLGDSSVIIGRRAGWGRQYPPYQAVWIGSRAGDYGTNSSSQPDETVAIGPETAVTGAGSIVVGARGIGEGQSTVVIGPDAEQQGMSYSTLVGAATYSRTGEAVVVGYAAQSSSSLVNPVPPDPIDHPPDVVIGSHAVIPYQGDGSVVVGSYGRTQWAHATALGSHAECLGENSVALGYGTIVDADTSDTVGVGPRDVRIQDASHGLVLQAPGGTSYRITVDDLGALIVTAVTP